MIFAPTRTRAGLTVRLRLTPGIDEFQRREPGGLAGS
jgi:hypothetical protein